MAEMKNTHLTRSLSQTAEDIVNIKSLGYIGIMIACLEDNGALPIYAYYIDPDVADESWIKSWEEKFSKILEKPISFSDPETACVYINDEEYKNNLGFKSVNKKDYVIDNDLFSLFVPILPNWTKGFVQSVQKYAGIEQVVSAPFFSANKIDGERIVLGNFFAVKKSIITDNDVQVLTAFGRSLATMIEFERLIGKRDKKNVHRKPQSKRKEIFSPEQPLIPPNDLKTIMCNHFNIEEFKNLCFEFDSRIENIQGVTKTTQVIELIQYADRRETYHDLLELVCKKRPKACERWDLMNGS